MFANKIKRVQACIDARGRHFQTSNTMYKCIATFRTHCITHSTDDKMNRRNWVTAENVMLANTSLRIYVLQNQMMMMMMMIIWRLNMVLYFMFMVPCIILYSINNQQMQLYPVNYIPLLCSLYMFRVFYTPIIRSTILKTVSTATGKDNVDTVFKIVLLMMGV